MNIGLDLSPLSTFRGGITTYTRSLLEALVGNGWGWYGYLYRGEDPGIAGLTVRKGTSWSRVEKTLWMRHEGSRLAGADPLDVFWATMYRRPRGKLPVVATVYDVMWKALPESMRFRTRWGLEAIAGRTIRSARRVVSISQATARDVKRYYGVDSTVIYPGVSLRPAPAKRGGYVLAVGTIEPRKNLARLFDALAQVPEIPRLLVVGPKGWKTSSILSRVHDRIEFMGYTDDLAGLYSGAEFLVYPSLYEGFGLPVVEAMACGCPVITSNVSSLPEAAGDAGILVDPTSTDAIAEAMRTLWKDRDRRESMRAKGLEHAKKFTWARAAKEYAAVFTDAAGPGPRDRRPVEASR